MRKTFRSILLALLFSNAIQAKTIQVASPGADKDIQPAIQTAVSGAVNGDVIELPAGQFILNKSVVITKFISVKGQGIGKTILYRSESTPDATLSNDGNWRGMFRYTINSTVSSGIVVSDMTLKSKRPSMVNGDGLSVAADIGIEMSRCIDFVITRCHFEYFGNGAVSVLHDDNLASGLIYGCEFIHNCKGYDALGLGYGVVVYGTNTKWVDDPKWGSGNFIFIEDNYFEYHRHSVAAGGCALYVFRYNTVKNNVAGNCAHAIDAHEARLEAGSNYYSTRAIEVYKNNIYNTQFRDGTTNCPDGTAIVSGKSPGWLTECAIRTRGGDAIIHDNSIEGYRFGVGLVTPKLSSTYPSPYQQGYLSGVKYGASHSGVDSDKAAGDVFIWNDTYKSYAPTSSQCVYFYNYTPDYIVQERDFHLYAKAGYTAYTYPHPLRNTTTPVAQMTLSNSVNNVTCNGAKNGSASVTVAGGTAPFTYSWNSSPVQTAATATGLAGGSYVVTVSDAAGNTKTATVTVTEPTALSTTFNYTLETCSKKNGTATAVVSGGASPYTYSWSTLPTAQTTATATGLTHGGYTVTVTDKNGCTQATKAIVTEATPLSASISATAESCGKKNGTATATVSTGTAPYTYVWSTSTAQTTATATGLSAGTYSATITDNAGCSMVLSATVTASASVNATTSMTAETCGKKNGTATATVSSGTAPFTYSWSTVPVQTTAKATGLSAGTYSVTVTDYNGCSTVVPVSVVASASLNVTTSATGETCGKKNGTATATVSSGTAPFTYSWSTVPAQTTATATGLTAGVYSVTVTDNSGCSQVSSVTITSTTALNVTANLTTENCGKKDGTATAVVTGGTAPYSYVWSTLPVVQTAATATGLTHGGYTVTVTDNNGCSQALPVIIKETAALSVTATQTTENCGKKDGTATAVVTGGTAPYTYVWSTLPTAQTTATATGLTHGGYTVTVTDKNGCTQTLPVVITESTSTLNVTADLTTENCGKKDGTATAVVSGGNAPYTYVWSTLPVVQTTATATGLTHGGYTVTVTDNTGCSKALPVVINETTTLSVTTNLTTENCGKKDGTATANVSGGIAPYTYVWTTKPVQTTATATGLVHGNYTVTVTDSKGCSVSTAVVIKTSYTPAAAVTANNANCSGKGGSASVKVTDGVAPFTYQWNTIPVQSTAEAINLTDGEYEVVIMDARGCTSSAKTRVAKSEPKFSLTTVKTDASCATCRDGSATVIVSGGETNSYAFAWSSKNSSITASGNSASGLEVGEYGVKVTDNKGCVKEATTVIGEAGTTGIAAEAAASEDITIFPNPALEKFNITNDAFKAHEGVLVVLYNTAGIEVYSKIIVKENEIIAVDTENRLEPGIYIVVASSQDHLYKKKIIISQ